MIVGLPGAGISCLFYVLCVVLMPLRLVYRAAIGRPLPRSQWPLVIRQWVIAASAVAALLATGWFVGQLALDAPATVVGPDGGVVTAQTESIGLVVARLGVLLAFATLFIVLTVVQIVSMYLRRKALAASLTRAVREGRVSRQRPAGFRPLLPLAQAGGGNGRSSVSRRPSATE